jgi:hypothetical protein
MSKEDSASTPVNQSNSGVEGDGNENGHSRITEKLPDVPGKIGAAKEKMMAKKPDDAPAGGYDDTPIPPAKDGYIVKFTFHRAENLPVSDLNSRSSDPYIHATLTSPLPKRHKEDPDLILRTPTVHKSVDPEFNTEWIVAGVPSSGFRLKCRLYDEDPSDHDDRLGNVAIHVDSIGKDWPGIQEQQFDIKKRMASKRAYLIRGCITLFNSDVHMDGRLVISAEVLGMSEKPFGGMYTLGQTSWYKHFSPMIGRLTGTKAPGDSDGADGKTEKYEYVPAEVIRTISDVITASKQISFSFKAQYLLNYITDLSSLSPLSRACSRKLASEDAS